jgi:diguanylate cyclase (GGDEF)-like protein
MDGAHSSDRLVAFLTAVSGHQDEHGATVVAAELAAQHVEADVGAVVGDGAVRAATGFGAGAPPPELSVVDPGADVIDLDNVGRCHLAVAAWHGDHPGRLVVARTGAAFDSHERSLLIVMARTLALTLRGVAALKTAQMLKQRQSLLEVLLEIQRAISHRAPLPEVLEAITAGASALLGGCAVSLVLQDALDPHRPIVASTATAATGVDAALEVEARVHVNGAPAGALVARSQSGAPLDDAQLSMLDAFAEHASLALTDARTVEAMQEAFHDSLTGLPNRALFLDRLRHALDVAARRATDLCVLFVDLDRFKAVNDSLGHAAGDHLLRTAAARLADCTRAADTTARFGGDEFAVLLENDGRGLQPDVVAERIIAAMRRPFRIDGKDVFIGATVGIALADGDALSPDELLRNADVAMYRAKKAGGNRAATFEASMRTALLQRIELEADLRLAVSRGALSIAYQPVVDLMTGRPVGVEALARWVHPLRGPIAPLTFIPLAEEIGVISELGRWVLTEACGQLAAWRALAPGLVLNVNLSAQQLRDPGLPEEVARTLSATGLPGSALTLEITESMLLAGEDDIAGMLRALKGLGLSIAIDDFGTGYSSLAYLRQFPVDALKIDKSFIDSVAGSAEDSALARTIVELGRGMRLETIAEGIESSEQLEHLRALRCELGQGYHFSHPLAGEDFTVYLRRAVRAEAARRVA